MKTPVDYPIVDRAHSAQFSVDELIYATQLDRMEIIEPTPEQAVVDAPVFSLKDSEPPVVVQKTLLQPFTVFAQTLLTGDGGARHASGMFSRWSRVLR